MNNRTLNIIGLSLMTLTSAAVAYNDYLIIGHVDQLTFLGTAVIFACGLFLAFPREEDVKSPRVE